MALGRIRHCLMQGCSIDTPLYNKSSDSVTPPAPVDPSRQVAAEAAANRYDVNSPFGTVRWSQASTPQALSYTDWLNQTFPGGVPTRNPTEEAGVPGDQVDPGKLYSSYVEAFNKNAPIGKYTQDIALSPEQQAQYEGRSNIARALLGRSQRGIEAMPEGYKFKGAEDPTTNRFFMAQKALLDPVFAKQEERLDQKLTNQGIPMGSEAYDYERSQFAKNRDSAYEKAAADALGLGFNQDLASRQQNYNEIAAALGGSQLNPVSAGGSGGALDVGNAFTNYQSGVNNQFQGQVANNNARIASNNQDMSALQSIATALVYFSDRRLKRNVKRIGTHPLGIGIYAFEYVWGGGQHVGVMADEVRKVKPMAVFNLYGLDVVNYGAL